MIIALLFNSDAPKYRGSYGWPIKRAVLGKGILQSSGRHMKVSLGDVLIYGHARDWEHHDSLCERVYFHHAWALLHEKRLRETFRQATVFALIFENMPKGIAESLHTALSRDKSYLGLQAVDYSYGPHLVFFRNFMSARYRIAGTSCRIFISMGSEDEKDHYEPDELRKLGFDDVDWEDRGAHKTIFDDYDTLEHFQQVAKFRETVTPFLPGGEDDGYELAMVLEDLSPQLFNVLGAAVESINSARHEEHIAQAALSGRRYMEKLADVLFPPQEAKRDGR